MFNLRKKMAQWSWLLVSIVHIAATEGCGEGLQPRGCTTHTCVSVSEDVLRAHILYREFDEFHFMCAALLSPNCRDAFLRLSQLPSLRDWRFYSAILLAETQECVSTTFRRTHVNQREFDGFHFMCAALLLPNCRDAFLRLSQLPSLRDRRFYSAILLAETQKCVSTSFRRTHDIIYNV